MKHWHAYTYTGQKRPKDAEARDPHNAAPPLAIAEWRRKPRGMLAGTFTDPEQALAWLADQLAQAPPLPTALPTGIQLAYARDRLAQHPGDQITRYYTATHYVVRDLLCCHAAPGDPECPDPPTPACGAPPIAGQT